MSAYENWRFLVEFTDGVWTDLTSRVESWNSPMVTTVGDTAEASGDAGGFTVVLRNDDQELTPGNPLSSFYPNVEGGKRARIVETIGYSTFDLASGSVDFPEISAWTQSDASAPRVQEITLPGIDLIAEHAQGPTFQSALSEHILYEGGADLAAYWPLTDESGPFLGVGPVLDPITVTRQVTGTCGPIEDAQPQAGTAPSASEGNGLRCEISTPNGGVGYGYVQLSHPTGLSVPVGAADSVTVVGWFSFGGSPLLSTDIMSMAVSNGASIFVRRDTTTGVWSLDVTGSMSGTASLGAIGEDALLPIAVRFNPAAATAEIWAGGQQVTAGLSGSPAGAMTLTSVVWGYQIAYDISHWQIYSGSTWGRDQFLAQTAFAHAPLDKQWTGERIQTIGRYAGIPAGELGRIDRGTVRMQPIVMAGRTVADLWGDAVETEQGRLWADGAGLAVFQDRRTVSNV